VLKETSRQPLGTGSSLVPLSSLSSFGGQNPPSRVNYLEYPTDIVCLVVFWRFRYKLSLRDLAEMFLQRGIGFTHEAVRGWETKLAPLLSDILRKRRRGAAGNSWYVDETYVKVQGEWHYLYRALDRDGHLLDARLSDTRDLAAAEAFFRSAWTVTGVTPDRITTDGHDAYPRGFCQNSQLLMVQTSQRPGAAGYRVAAWLFSSAAPPPCAASS
jgi:putative transposase